MILDGAFESTTTIRVYFNFRDEVEIPACESAVTLEQTYRKARGAGQALGNAGKMASLTMLPDVPPVMNTLASITQTAPGKFTITALKKGKATITVKTFNGKSTKFNLTVK